MCHDYGNIYRDYPQNYRLPQSKQIKDVDEQIFSWAQKKKRATMQQKLPKIPNDLAWPISS